MFMSVTSREVDVLSQRRNVKNVKPRNLSHFDRESILTFSATDICYGNANHDDRTKFENLSFGNAKVKNRDFVGVDFQNSWKAGKVTSANRGNFRKSEMRNSRSTQYYI